MNFVYEFTGFLARSEDPSSPMVLDGEGMRSIMFIRGRSKGALVMRSFTSKNGNNKPDDGFVALGGALRRVDGRSEGREERSDSMIPHTTFEESPR